MEILIRGCKNYLWICVKLSHLIGVANLHHIEILVWKHTSVTLIFPGKKALMKTVMEGYENICRSILIIGT